MAIIRPPVSGDSPQDSWANQVTEAINKGLLGPSVNAVASGVVGVDGFSAATIYLYTRTTTASPPTAVDVDITFDYKNVSYSPSPPFGTANWEITPPGTANGDYLWVTVVNVSANTQKEIIPFASWSTPQIFSVNGSSSFVCEAYIRLSTVPGTPSGGSYDFSTTTLTPPTGSPASEVWSSSLPAGSDPVYICTAIAVISGTAGVDNSLTWSQPVKMVEDGVSGPDLESGLVYYTSASASNPGSPSATDYNFTTGAFVGLTSGWQTQPVVVNITSTTALFWSARYRITKGPNDATATVTFNAPVASVNFGTNIQSDNYVSGSAGWQIQRASGDAEFNNITARGNLESGSFDGTLNSLSNTISTYSTATGTFSANVWGLRDGFSNNASNISAGAWTAYLDPVSNTDHVVLKVRASTAAVTKIISQLGRGQEITITRNASNYAVFEVWQAGYLPEDGNTAYIQLRTLTSSIGSPSNSAITLAASNVVDPGTEGYLFSDDVSVINSGTLDVSHIRINGSIQAKNLDIGVTLQSKSGSRSGVSTAWREFLRLETADNPDYNTDVSYDSQVTVVSEAGVGDIVFCKVLDETQLGTEGSATYSSSQIGLSVGSTTSFTNTIDSASIQANSPNQSSSFTTSMSDSNVNVTRATIYIFCYRERPGGDTAIGCSASGSITEVRRPA